VLCNVDGYLVAGCQTREIDDWMRGETLVVVEVTKRPDRRPPSHAVYRRLASTACLPVSDPIGQLTPVPAQDIPHSHLHWLRSPRKTQPLTLPRTLQILFTLELA